MYHYKAKLVRVVDGDTLDLDIDLGMNVHIRERVRLAAIDTPETYGVKKDSEEYKKGIAAKEFVEETLSKADEIEISSRKHKKGKYGRYIVDLCLVTYNEIDDRKEYSSLNLLLVEKGFAKEKIY